MTADEKMNNLGLVNRGSKKFPDYGHKDDDKYTEVSSIFLIMSLRAEEISE